MRATERVPRQVYITGHLPRQSHVLRVEFPRTLTEVGPHVVHFMWRGYTGCIDVDILGDDKPVLNTSRHMMGYSAGSYRMIKARCRPTIARTREPTEARGSSRVPQYDHTQFDIGTYHLTGLNTGCVRGCTAAHRGCWVVPPPGQFTSDGMSHEDALNGAHGVCLHPPARHQICHAVVCVPLVPAPHARFGGLGDRNIPFAGGAMFPSDQDASLTKCNADFLHPDRQPNGSQVCYGVKYNSSALSHDGRVGDPWTTSEDPRDDIFYSTMYLKREDWRFDSPDCAECRRREVEQRGLCACARGGQR